MATGPHSGASPQVAAPLQPTRSFDTACARVIDYLCTALPMGAWVVTRLVDDRQLILTARGEAYELEGGRSLPFAQTLCSRMASGEAPRIAPDVSLVPAYARIAAALPLELGAYVGTPIVWPDGTLFGTVCGFDPAPKPDAMRAHLPLLDLLSSLLSAVLEADLGATSAARALEMARREAEVDPLTGLLNRRGWDRFLGHEEERFRRFGDSASVVVIDLDNLKEINDTFGHEAGDRYIRAAARALAGTVRSGDVLARLGGDEFGVVAVGCTPDQAADLVVRAGRALEAAGISGSFGHAPYSIVTGFPGAWRAADEAMYAQKRRRRGRPPRHARSGPG
ncbi:diguanylate cyclase with GAF sensor [Pseudonocardia dioxanivorans CB1190]|uniref:Diguanylate cyclase with GAF sensor n=1 Tax=Pseudonocardia dioxanivorans (strain ATCC 55486 / DSM 44775 / JCM 13855 / CB1190) TaxID=675635 RepID=F4CIV8_PSEUX|nr:sensor domain-containing diguanylate cyclase [Pseudonocardia dioxanivorans]AEA22937.1 diguanylate cyclase with GAF sensor [Pseudonocardia dioxanivorans CB1190]